MNNIPDYRKLVDCIRRRHIMGGGLGWPGKPPGAEAFSRYPNIAAELYAHGWLNRMAEFAEVSPEIMAAVIEDGEDLILFERRRLSARWEGRRTGYLFSPILQLVDPTTNKGKRRRRELADLTEKAVGPPWRLRRAERVRDALAAGCAVTYAEWWWACHDMREALEEEERKRIRTERTATA